MTILGQWSAAELVELLAAKDAELSQLEAAYNAYASTWAANDAAAQSAWYQDFQNLKDRYKTAKVVADTAILAAKATPISLANIPTNTVYNNVLSAVQTVPQAKGDLQELNNRLKAAQGKSIAYNIPQPSSDNDTDMKVFNKLRPLDVIGDLKAREKGKSLLYVGVAVASVAGAGYLYLLSRRLS